MDAGGRDSQTAYPMLLLVEADTETRLRHEVELVAAGYAVTSIAACPASHEVVASALVLTDIPSFDWLHEQRMGRLPPIIALTDDVRAGVMACLCGAAAWVPTAADGGYLLDTIDGLLHLPEHARYLKAGNAVRTAS